MTNKTITVSVKIGEKEFEKTSTVQQVENDNDVLTLLQADSALVIKNLNYAMDLKERAKVSASIRQENVDPSKATNKAFEDFNKARAAVGKSALTREAFDALMAA